MGKPTKEYANFIRHVYRDVVQNFNGNPRYVFVGGFSAGGFMSTGPVIQMIRQAKLRHRLAGVAAGGCRWVGPLTSARGLNIIMWYADNDPNSRKLPRQLAGLRRYAKKLTIVFHKGAGHRCDNDFEGPALRKFFAFNGPDKEDFRTLDELRVQFGQETWRRCLWPCYQIVQKRNTASPAAKALLNKMLAQMETESVTISTPKEKESLNSLATIASHQWRVWNLTADFQRLCACIAAGWAENHLNQWFCCASHSRLEPVKGFAKLICPHLDCLLAWTNVRITTGVLEAVTDKLKLFSRRIRGIRNDDRYIESISHPSVDVPIAPE